jgi:aspartyl-tRNA(Asn)/glutamyl-tRNA(Gln) amidotransferase subunit C
VTGEKLTRDDAAYVARLARIDLTAEELDLYAGQLAVVIDNAGQVAALDTTGVEPTAHPLPLKNVLRDDEPRPSLDRDVVLGQAPAVEDGRFRVPKILGDVP